MCEGMNFDKRGGSVFLPELPAPTGQQNMEDPCPRGGKHPHLGGLLPPHSLAPSQMERWAPGGKGLWLRSWVGRAPGDGETHIHVTVDGTRPPAVNPIPQDSFSRLWAQVQPQKSHHRGPAHVRTYSGFRDCAPGGEVVRGTPVGLVLLGAGSVGLSSGKQACLLVSS